MSRSNLINFAPYEPPPDAPQSSTSRSIGAKSSSRSKSPWFARTSSSSSTPSKTAPPPPLSYQSGGRTADLQSSNPYFQSSSASSTSSQAQATTLYSNVSGDVLWDVENGAAGPSHLSSSSNSISNGNASHHATGNRMGNSSNTHNQYETTYGWRVDLAAAAAYLLGPFLAILLLILETKNDYIRFHAWQSLLLGSLLAALHLLLLWSNLFTYLPILAYLFIYVPLAYRAARDGETLERYSLPRIGEIAFRWTEEE